MKYKKLLTADATNNLSETPETEIAALKSDFQFRGYISFIQSKYKLNIWVSNFYWQSVEIKHWQSSQNSVSNLLNKLAQYI